MLVQELFFSSWTCFAEHRLCLYRSAVLAVSVLWRYQNNDDHQQQSVEDIKALSVFSCSKQKYFRGYLHLSIDCTSDP